MSLNQYFVFFNVSFYFSFFCERKRERKVTREGDRDRRQGEKKKNEGKERSFHWFSLQMPAILGLGWAEVKSQKLCPEVSHGQQGLRDWGHPLLSS